VGQEEGDAVKGWVEPGAGTTGFGTGSASDYEMTLRRFLPYWGAGVVFCKMRRQGRMSAEGFPWAPRGCVFNLGLLLLSTLCLINARRAPRARTEGPGRRWVRATRD